MARNLKRLNMTYRHPELDLTGENTSSLAASFLDLQAATKIIKTHHIFIKKIHRKILDLLKVTQNPHFPLTQSCTKTEEPCQAKKTRNWQ